MDVMRFHPENPLRPPHWRWGRALVLHDHRWGVRRIDDAWIRRARRVLAALGRRAGDLGDPRVAAVGPAIVEAYRLHAGGGARRRMEVEARLLAGQDDEAIATCLGLDAGVVEAYAALFFDVRDSLGKVDWIAGCVLGARLFDGTGVGDEDLGSKLAAYNFGPFAVDVFFGRHTANSAVGPSRLAGALRRYLAAATAPVTARDAPRWLAVTARMDEIEREEAASCLAAVSGPIRVRDDILATFSTAGSTVDSKVAPVVSDVVNRDDDPAVNIPEVVAEGLDDFLDRRTA